MSEENIDYEAKARKMGWIPESQFKGEPGKWVDAETFVKRGEEYMPFIKAENRKLKEQLDGANSKLTTLETTLAETNKSIEQLKKYNNEMTQTKIKEARRQLLEELKVAKREGDVDREVEITDKLDEVKEALKTADDEPPKPAPATKPTEMTAEAKQIWNEWLEENPWWKDNRRMRALSTDVAAELQEAGEISQNMDPRERLRKIADKTHEVWAELTGKSEEPPEPRSKVEGSRNGGGNSPGAGGGKRAAKGYGSLPADAKAACDRFAEDMVGPNKLYKDLKAWQAKYSEDYFTNA